MNRSELKAEAKKSLKGKYGDAIKMILIYGLISFISGFLLGFLGEMLGIDSNIIDLIASIISIFLTGIFGFGISSYYLKISRNQNVTYKELFSKTNLFLPYIIISVVTGIFTFLWTILLIIPGIIAAISYSLVYFIKLDNPEMSTIEVIRKSKNMMYGYKMDYFILMLSFIGWILLGTLTIGILYLWLIPYMAVTEANFYNKLKELETTY